MAMASNLLSRLLPATTGSPSIYETIRQHDEESDTSDIEERAGMALDEENLGERFHDYELEDALAQASESQMTTKSGAKPGGDTDRQTRRAKNAEGAQRTKAPSRSRARGKAAGLVDVDELDDEVPASLLVEGTNDGDVVLQSPPMPPNKAVRRRMTDLEASAIPAPGPSTTEVRQQWQAARAQQRLHPEESRVRPRHIVPQTPVQHPRLGPVSPKDRAMWRWANVENLDNFLLDVYVYFVGNGIWCINLGRGLNLLTSAFVVGFTTFLGNCIDYRSIPNSKKMDDIIVPRCTSKMSGTWNFVLWISTMLWIWKFIQFALDFRRLRQMHDFYFYCLGISDTEVQTISWQEVVSRLMALREANPSTAATTSARHRRFLGTQSKQRMDAQDIANRLMRRENYLVALFNKEILDLTLPVPFFRNRQLFSRTLEWNINLCVLDWVFNQNGQIKPIFLKDTYRKSLSDALRRRFLVAGVLNIFIAPFIVTYFLLHYFFQYFTEYQKNPAEIGSRQYTPLAEWKFREFNELYHLFVRRLNMSYPFASRYVDQFPKEKTVQVARFVSFIAGALASILALASVLDPELFLNFEITRDRTVLFYLGIFGSVWAVARGIVPAENVVFDPEFALQEVTDFTHYHPSHWDGRLHTDEVRKEFAMLYQLKLVIFLEEILSMIFTPFVLWFSLPKCSDRIIDFFREFTLHVDGLGYVCSFAVFDFKKSRNATTQGQDRRTGATGLRDDYYATKDQKLEASYWGFMNDYAQNPKTGIPFLHSSTRRRYHPPPPFPGLMSPTLQADMNGAAVTSRHDRWNAYQRPTGRPSPTGGAFGMQSVVHGTPHVGIPQNMEGSPLTSLLLDPHHQPSASTFRNLSRPSTQSRYRPARGQPVADTIEDEEENAGENHTQPITSSGGMADDSNLGDSWKVNQAGSVEDDEDEDNDVTKVAGEKGTGVLGLIAQFQKAHAEGRGAGVNM